MQPRLYKGCAQTRDVLGRLAPANCKMSARRLHVSPQPAHLPGRDAHIPVVKDTYAFLQDLITRSIHVLYRHLGTTRWDAGLTYVKHG